ncbi:MAG: ATP synthase F1 subunit delta [Mycoplasmoidaceae bacterium]
MMRVNSSYSVALYEIYKETKNQKKFYEDVQSLYFSIRLHENLINILSSRMLSKEQRKKIIDNIFDNKIEELIRNFLYILIDDEYFKNVLPILKTSLKAIDLDKNQLFVKIETAQKLDDANLKKILESIKKKWNKNFDYSITINHELIGGIKISVNDEEIDGTIKGKLDQIKREVELKK